MKRKKSPRNKTIDIGIEEGRQYLERCIKVSRPVQIDEVINKTIAGICFKWFPACLKRA